MDIVISTLEQAILNAVNLLTRSRMKRGGPFYLLKPQHPLRIQLLERSLKDHNMHVQVRCKTWGFLTGETSLKLTLVEDNQMWLPWGPFSIHYASDYPIDGLSKGVVVKDMYPMYVHRPSADRMFELRIRSRVRPGR